MGLQRQAALRRVSRYTQECYVGVLRDMLLTGVHTDVDLQLTQQTRLRLPRQAALLHSMPRVAE